jgi:hypothetical protein
MAKRAPPPKSLVRNPVELPLECRTRRTVKVRIQLRRWFSGGAPPTPGGGEPGPAGKTWLIATGTKTPGGIGPRGTGTPRPMPPLLSELVKRKRKVRSSCASPSLSTWMS